MAWQWGQNTSVALTSIEHFLLGNEASSELDAISITLYFSVNTLSNLQWPTIYCLLDALWSLLILPHSSIIEVLNVIQLVQAL